jgi:hypothetical protein
MTAQNCAAPGHFLMRPGGHPINNSFIVQGQ